MPLLKKDKTYNSGASWFNFSSVLYKLKAHDTVYLLSPNTEVRARRL